MKLGAGVWAETLEKLRACGRGRRECVVYWLAPLASSKVIDEVVHPVHSASVGHYEIDQKWLGQFWTDLADQQKRVVAQVHTHLGAAFHSATDDEWPLIHAPGFLSLVVPNGALNENTEGLFLTALGKGGVWDEQDPRSIEGMP